MADGRSSGLRIAISVIFALIFAIIELPDFMNAARPHLLLLFVIYWSLSSPRIAGLMFAWLCGFAIDVIKGPVFGQHAAAYLLVAYLTHKFQLRLRIFPIYQQTMWVLVLLVIYEFVVFWIDGIIGPAVTTWLRWLPVLTSTLLWPVVVATLDTWNRARR
ncbi:rod shape-determining protein MreD [Povalibacter uvarum]|uniref:Rod shape-determining protein MreD n=1 Tax=Povalibacter uvarum TaxID=732238 RepID=A0A841HPY9_9GAMM|nr:rod shape-determining protein MreD [Povalibacter uvarum]MBB6094399.1 rod shape-determining protein MreD [Povalibacter uvarum]